MSAAEVVGRPLADFVAPEYVELVANNLRRRLPASRPRSATKSSSSARTARSRRVELSSTVIDSAGEPALLLTALEMLAEPAAGVRRRRGRAPW